MPAERSEHLKRAGSETCGAAVAVVVPTGGAVDLVEGGQEAATALDRLMESEVEQGELQLSFAETVRRPTVVTIRKKHRCTTPGAAPYPPSSSNPSRSTPDVSPAVELIQSTRR